MILGRVFNYQSISFDFASTDKRDVIQELAQKLVVSQPSLNYDKVLSALLQREGKLSTGIGRGVAIPHALCEQLVRFQFTIESLVISNCQQD